MTNDEEIRDILQQLELDYIAGETNDLDFARYYVELVSDLQEPTSNELAQLKIAKERIGNRP